MISEKSSAIQYKNFHNSIEADDNIKILKIFNKISSIQIIKFCKMISFKWFFIKINLFLVENSIIKLY